MPMKIPQNTAAAAGAGSSRSVSRVAANLRIYSFNPSCTSKPFLENARLPPGNNRQLAARHLFALRADRALDAGHGSGLGQFRSFNAQCRAGSHGLEELEAIDRGQQRRSHSLAWSCRAHHHRRRLRHRLDHQHAGQYGPGGKMPLKDRVPRIHIEPRNATNARLRFLHPVDPQKWRAMRNDFLDFVSLNHFGFITSKVSAGSFAFSVVKLMRKTLLTPLLPSTSSERSRKSRLLSFTIR